MTVGAASGLNVILKTVLNPGEEVIVFAPYFLEYGAYVKNYDGKLVEISPDTETFQDVYKRQDEKLRDYMCSNFYDIRAFGAVMTTFVKAALNLSLIHISCSFYQCPQK